MSDKPRITPASVLSRRRLMALTAGGLFGGALLAACGDDDDDSGSGTNGAGAAGANDQTTKGRVIVGDVVDHALRSDRWRGEFGFVTFKLHTGSVDDQPAYFIRTDASEQAFASAEKLVFVPKMASALAGGGRGLSSIYLFSGGAVDQTPVLSSAPHRPDFSPAFRVHRVSFTGAPRKLGSVSAIQAAERDGLVRVEQTNIVVNYPVVKWPGGELPVDDAKEAYLGAGQLISPVDVSRAKVTFKLHACYPNSRYIVTDATMMADMMNIAPAPGAEPLTAAGATAKILVFGSGVEGSGPMGFQKSITDTKAGEAAWSPYWDHYTFTWTREEEAVVLKSQADLLAKEQAGALERFNGTPDTNGQLFMVNCPVPVEADVV
jgi:hypothetical protein